MQTKGSIGTTCKKLQNKHNHEKQKYAHHRYTINTGTSTPTKATIIFFCCPDVTKEIQQLCSGTVLAEWQCRRPNSPVLDPSSYPWPDVQDKPFWSSLRWATRAAPSWNQPPQSPQDNIMPFLIKVLFQVDWHVKPTYHRRWNRWNATFLLTPTQRLRVGQAYKSDPASTPNIQWDSSSAT